MDPLFELEAGEEKSLRESVSQESVEKKRVKKDYKYATWFCTWAKCPVAKEVILGHLDKKWDHAIKEYIFAQEHHKDQSLHVHALITLNKRVRFKKDLFDFTDLGKLYHGSYEPPKSIPASRDYLQKEDKDVLTNINLKSIKQKQSKKIGIEELEKDALDLLEEGVISGMQLANFIKNQNIYKFLKQKRDQTRILINLNIEKKRHFWFYGESNSGKTYNLRQMMLSDPQNWFQIPTNNDWIGYNNEQNLYLDEFKGQLSIQELNRICDGGAKVNIKGGSTQLHPECKVYICSNYNIKECYEKAVKEKPTVIESLYNRFNEKRCYFTEQSDGSAAYHIL